MGTDSTHLYLSWAQAYLLLSAQLKMTFTIVGGKWVKPTIQGRNVLQKEKKISSKQLSVLIKLIVVPINN